jgi:hypothetical protein
MRPAMREAPNGTGRFMSASIVRSFFLYILFLTCNASAQNILEHVLTNGSEDMAEIKRKAEEGDAASQFKLADSLAAISRSADAFKWYSKAALQGDRECFYLTGRMLLYGAAGSSPDQTLAANPAEGIRIIYRAATLGHPTAPHDMFRAYKEGLGVAKDQVQAYAWLQLHVDAMGALLPASEKVELNQLALEVDVATSQEGKRLAALYKSGNWPTLVVAQPNSAEAQPAAPTRIHIVAEASDAGKPASIQAVPLRLNGIISGQRPMAIINGKSVEVGETVTIPTKPQNTILKCLKIDAEAVLVKIESESEPRELRLKSSSPSDHSQKAGE